MLPDTNTRTSKIPVKLHVWDNFGSVVIYDDPGTRTVWNNITVCGHCGTRTPYECHNTVFWINISRMCSWWEKRKKIPNSYFSLIHLNILFQKEFKFISWGFTYCILYYVSCCNLTIEEWNYFLDLCLWLCSFFPWAYIICHWTVVNNFNYAGNRVELHCKI